MAADISIHSFQPGAQGGSSGASGAGAASGAFMGNAAVVVADPMSLLADAAEELTFAVDSTDDFKLSEREEDDKALKAREDRVKLYQDLMHQAGKTEEMHQMADRLRASRTKSDVRRLVREHFPDPADAYAVLEFALETLEDKGASPESIQAVTDARDELLAEEGPVARAGMQAMLSAGEYGGLDAADALRGLYRRAVCDFPGVNEMFDHILEKYGADKFGQALDFLTRTLGADMAAAVPSMEKTRLESVNANLGLVRQLQSAHALCAKVMDRWQNTHGIEKSSLDARTLLGEILALRGESFLGSAHFNRIAAKAGPPDIEREVLFLQDVMQMIRSLPSQLFDGNSGHLKVLDAVQDAVDEAIEREDAFYAARREE